MSSQMGAGMMNGTEMRKLRETLGMEQPELAEALGKAKRAETVSRWENDKNPIPKSIEKLLRSIVASHRRKKL